jgi:hypothetical protein
VKVPKANIVALFGDTVPTTCKLCGKTQTRFGTLVDCNGHTWLICMECVDGLWSRNAAVIVDAEIEERARQLVQEKLFGLSDD